MVTVGLLIRLEAKPGKEDEVAKQLAAAIDVVNKEEGTTAWFALRFGPASFGVFDAFPDDTARQVHLSDNLGAMQAAIGELVVAAPTVEPADVLVAKLPGRQDGRPRLP